MKRFWGAPGHSPDAPGTLQRAIGTPLGWYGEAPKTPGAIPRLSKSLPRCVGERSQHVFWRNLRMQRFSHRCWSNLSTQNRLLFAIVLVSFFDRNFVLFSIRLPQLFVRRQRRASIDGFSPNLNPYRPQWCFRRIRRSRMSFIEGRNDGRRDRTAIPGTIENPTKNRWNIDGKSYQEVNRKNNCEIEPKWTPNWSQNGVRASKIEVGRPHSSVKTG